MCDACGRTASIAVLYCSGIQLLCWQCLPCVAVAVRIQARYASHVVLSITLAAA